MELYTSIWSRFVCIALSVALASAVMVPALKAQTPSMKRKLNTLEKKIEKLAGPTEIKQPQSKSGDWIGRLTIDAESQPICALKIKGIKASFERQVMTVDFDNDGNARKLELLFDGKNNFSKWLTMTFEFLKYSRFLDRPFSFKGVVEGNVLSGSFYTDVTRVGDSCSGDLYFVKKGTLEAKAFLEKRDPRIVKLEHTLAQLQKAQQKKQKKTSNKGAKNQKALLESAVAELMRFRALQKKEQARLAKLKLESKTQAKELLL